jgi:hypothetical protein
MTKGTIRDIITVHNVHISSILESFTFYANGTLLYIQAPTHLTLQSVRSPRYSIDKVFCATEEAPDRKLSRALLALLFILYVTAYE